MKFFLLLLRTLWQSDTMNADCTTRINAAVRSTMESNMANDKQTVHLSHTISSELNDRLEHLAAQAHSTKSEILRKAIALFDVVSEAAVEKMRFGILDENKQLVTEIVGI